MRAALAEGAELVTGGGRPAHLDRGFYVEPTLLVGQQRHEVAREEIFGPVVVVIPFDDEEEGVALSNDSDFGLYDYVFSADTSRAYRVARQLRAGHVGINTAQRNHEAAFRRVQAFGCGARRGRLRARGLLGDAGHRLVELTRSLILETEG